MSTITIEERIEKVVDDFVAGNKMFTLLDISQTVKRDGGPWVSHSSMKPIIEDVLRNRFMIVHAYAYYTESLITVDTPVGLASARLFHPVGEDPNSYTNRQQIAIAPKAQTKTTVTVQANQVSAGHPTLTSPLVKKARRAQCQGYIEVPKSVWVGAGFLPGNTVVFQVHPESLTIYCFDKQFATVNKYYGKAEQLLKDGAPSVRIPPAGRFRLSPTILKEANLSDKELDFSKFTSKIVVSVKV